nr:MAG TPA: hypothetical protein [Bacteriophage sp.]
MYLSPFGRVFTSIFICKYKKKIKNLTYDFDISEYTKSIHSSYCHSIDSLSLDRKSMSLDLSL